MSKYQYNQDFVEIQLDDLQPKKEPVIINYGSDNNTNNIHNDDTNSNGCYHCKYICPFTISLCIFSVIGIIFIVVYLT